MADYLTTDTELASVANAIRTKGGTSDPLEWPQGYVDAIGAISGGGGGTEKTVTITLRNPTSSSYAANPCCILYESDDLFGELTQIGQISSPTGTATVTVKKPVLTATFYSNSSYLNVLSARPLPVYSGATPFIIQFCRSDSLQFFVCDDDSVEIHSVDYNDD